MNIYFITGASRGIGAELAKQLLNKENIVIAIARTRNEELINFAKMNNFQLKYLQADLAELTNLKPLIEIMHNYINNKTKCITLINNAGIIEPIGRAEQNSIAAINLNITVNLTAPMALTSIFIKELADYQIDKKIINISSGAGRKVYDGWSSYCTAKAGLDHFSEVVASEQSELENGVKIMSIAPGIIDTDMQTTIRSSHKSAFRQLDRFINYKEKGLLATPEQTARKLIKIINDPNFVNLPVITDLREF